MPTPRFHVAAAAIISLTTLAVADDATSPTAPRGRLEVAGGGLAGDLVPVPEAPDGGRDTLLWRSPRFAAPFEFRIGELSGIVFTAPVRPPEGAIPFVYLRGGDAIAGTVETLDADALVMQVGGADDPARLRIARAEVVAISRSGEGAGSYTGPAGLTGWDQTPTGSWREEAGRIMTDKTGAVVTRDVAAPARARFDIRLSRRRAAEFRLSLAAADRPADDGYLLQALSDDVMLVRRAGGRAAIEALPAVAWPGDTLRVVLFVDQTRGRLAAVLPDAADAAARAVREVTLPPAGVVEQSGRFRLELTAGEICLERIEVTPWRGDEPALRPAAETAILTKTGPLEGFAVTSFDGSRGEYVFTRGGETRRVAAADVEEICFPPGDEAATEGSLRVVGADGGTLTGDLVKVDDRRVWVRRRGVDEPVAVPRDAIVAMRSLREAPPRPGPAGRVGTLVVGEDRVVGRVAGADDATGIAWHPVGSVNAAAFADAVDAEVEYVPRRPEKKKKDVVEVGGIGAIVNRDAAGFFVIAMMTADGAAARDGRIDAGDRIVAVAPAERARFVETRELDNETVTHLLRGRVGTTVRMKVTDGGGANPRELALVRGPINVAGRETLEQALQTHARLAGVADAPAAPAAVAGDYPAVIVLRNGDMAPCRIESIDADGLTLRSPVMVDAATAVRVPATLVRAVELAHSETRILDTTLRDRLLTLPRMQRDRPPTHLLRLSDGDYLRGRLLRVDDQTVSFEVLDVVKQMPRSRVARLIWLHPQVPPPADGAEAPAEPAPEDAGVAVQGIAPDGRRLTLVASGAEGDRLLGRSRALGAAVMDLGKVDRLLLGGAIERDVRELPYTQWKLHPAPEPRALGKPF